MVDCVRAISFSCTPVQRWRAGPVFAFGVAFTRLPSGAIALVDYRPRAVPPTPVTCAKSPNYLLVFRQHVAQRKGAALAGFATPPTGGLTSRPPPSVVIPFVSRACRGVPGEKRCPKTRSFVFRSRGFAACRAAFLRVNARGLAPLGLHPLATLENEDPERDSANAAVSADAIYRRSCTQLAVAGRSSSRFSEA